MSSDIQPGDVVVRVAGNCGWSGHAHAYQGPKITVVGRHYRVAGVRSGPFPNCRAPLGLFLVGVPSNALGVCSLGYRKLNDEPDNAEIIERIRACKPVKVLAAQSTRQTMREIAA